MKRQALLQLSFIRTGHKAQALLQLAMKRQALLLKLATSNKLYYNWP